MISLTFCGRGRARRKGPVFFVPLSHVFVPFAALCAPRYINRGVHAAVIYVISEVFFGSIRLERRARTRVPATPGLKPCNRFNVKQYSGQLYAIRLCARDKPPTLFLFANRLSRGVRARAGERIFARTATRSARQLRSIPSVVLVLTGARLPDDAPLVFRGSGEFSRVGEEEIGGWKMEKKVCMW